MTEQRVLFFMCKVWQLINWKCYPDACFFSVGSSPFHPITICWLFCWKPHQLILSKIYPLIQPLPALVLVPNCSWISPIWSIIMASQRRLYPNPWNLSDQATLSRKGDFADVIKVKDLAKARVPSVGVLNPNHMIP